MRNDQEQDGADNRREQSIKIPPRPNGIPQIPRPDPTDDRASDADDDGAEPAELAAAGNQYLSDGADHEAVDQPAENVGEQGMADESLDEIF